MTMVIYAASLLVFLVEKQVKEFMRMEFSHVVSMLAEPIHLELMHVESKSEKIMYVEYDTCSLWLEISCSWV